MTETIYFPEEENAKEESINNYADLFYEYLDNPPTLPEALRQLFTSGGAPQNSIDSYIDDIIKKAKSVFNDEDRLKKIKDKYPNLSMEDAKIITSYTCECMNKNYNPYSILNRNLVKDDRKLGIQNVSKYFYILLMALRKLPKYYPGGFLYRSITNIVDLENPYKKKYVPYKIGNVKTLWGFTSTSTNPQESYAFLENCNTNQGHHYKRGTVFSLSGNLWGYDIAVLSYYPKEEEILLEPERKYTIEEIFPKVNDIITIRGKMKDTPIVLGDINKKNELIYEVDSNGEYNILGEDFVNNNKENINLIINGEKHELKKYAYLKEGKNTIKLKIKNKLTNASHMFYIFHKNIINLESLKNLDVSDVNDFSAMFCSCKSLSNLDFLEKWNVSKGENFSGMFHCCFSLSNVDGLKNWDVSKGNNFSEMFYCCSSITNINALQNWNVSNGTNFCCMFKGCKFSDIKPLENWNVSNGTNFSHMFNDCESMSDVKPLENWNVSNGTNFSGMFYECGSLSNINALQNWNVSNGTNFSSMFNKCRSLSDIKPLENWNVSNGTHFSSMFDDCESMLDVKPLKNWNVSNGTNFSFMFYRCRSLSNIKPLQNWNVPNGTNFSGMFRSCSPSLDLKPLERWIKINEKAREIFSY